MKLSSTPLLGCLAVLALACASVHAAPPPPPPTNVTVHYTDPKLFTETKRSAFAHPIDANGYLEPLKAYIAQRASRILGPGQRLDIKVTDVDLAGEYEPWHGPRLSDIRIIKESRQRDRIREYDSAWKVEGPGQLHPEVQPASEGGRKFDLPMLILFGTEPKQHEKRHNEPGTLENVAAKLRLGADSIKTGQAAGIVGWYTPKQRGSKYVEVFAEVAKTIHDLEK